jgi:hypothetical protein
MHLSLPVVIRKLPTFNIGSGTAKPSFPVLAAYAGRA